MYKKQCFEFHFIFCFLLFSCSGNAASCGAGEEKVKQILMDSEFTGIVDSSSNLTFEGSIEFSGSFFCIYYYSREFGNHRMAQRLIILERNSDKYLGMYNIDDKPISIVDNEIRFTYDQELGDRIVFTGSLPPRQIVLNGIPRELFN